MKKELKKHNFDNEVNLELIQHQELLTVYKRLLLINSKYFSNVINTIESDLNFENLYMNNNLSEDEKFNLFKKQLLKFSNRMNELVNNEASFNSTKSKMTNENEYMKIKLLIEDEVKKMDEILTREETIAKVGKEINTNQSLFNKEDISSAKIIAQKLTNGADLRDNEAVYKYIRKISNEVRKDSDNTKTKLRTYKIKWIWYVAIMAALIIGTILCIIIPMYV